MLSCHHSSCFQSFGSKTVSGIDSCVNYRNVFRRCWMTLVRAHQGHSAFAGTLILTTKDVLVHIFLELFIVLFNQVAITTAASVEADCRRQRLSDADVIDSGVCRLAVSSPLQSPRNPITCKNTRFPSPAFRLTSQYATNFFLALWEGLY